MLIKDLQSGTIRKYGSDCHDSLAISQDGRTLSYYNLQCGDGSQYGDFRFVMEDGEVPQDSHTPDAMHCACYFNIGGFDIDLSEHDKQIRSEVIDEFVEKICNYTILCTDEETEIVEVKDILKLAEQMKGKQNG